MQYEDRDDIGLGPFDFVDDESPMEGTVDWMPIADSFPEELWCLHYPDRDTYFCVAIPGDKEVFGLVALSSRDLGKQFIEAVMQLKPDAAGCQPVFRTFDEVRCLVKARNRVYAVLLMDDPAHPHVHYCKAAHE